MGGGSIFFLSMWTKNLLRPKLTIFKAKEFNLISLSQNILLSHLKLSERPSLHYLNSLLKEVCVISSTFHTVFLTFLRSRRMSYKSMSYPFFKLTSSKLMNLTLDVSVSIFFNTNMLCFKFFLDIIYNSLLISNYSCLIQHFTLVS